MRQPGAIGSAAIDAVTRKHHCYFPSLSMSFRHVVTKYLLSCLSRVTSQSEILIIDSPINPEQSKGFKCGEDSKNDTREQNILTSSGTHYFSSLYDKKSTNSLRKKEQAKERKLKLTFINN